MSRIPLRARLVLLMLLCISACGDENLSGPRYSVEAPFDFVVAPTGQPTFRLQAITGSVDISRGAAGSDVHIQGKRRVEANTRAEAEERLADLQVEVVKTSEALVVRTLQPPQTGAIGYEVDYEISVPPGLFLEVNQVTGAVRIRGATSGVDIRNVTGSLLLEEIECSIDLHLTTGAIVATVTLPPNGHADLSLVTGTMALYVPRTTSASLDANVTTGTLTCSGLAFVDEDPRENVLRTTLGSGEGSIDLSCVTGSIVVAGW